MTYEEFKITITACVANLAGEEVSVKIHQVPKNNGILLDALTVMRPMCHVAPTIYLKDYYLRYKQDVPLEKLAEEIVRIGNQDQVSSNVPTDFFTDFAKVKSRICFKVIHYEKNREMLANMPYKRVLNLALVFYYTVEPSILENASVLVRNCDLERWGTNQKEIEKLAAKNTPKLLPWRYAPMIQVIEEIMEATGADSTDELDPDEEGFVPMYILTNTEKYYGASCIFYPNVLAEIAEQIGDHLYILPSSLHECIIMPASGLYSQESLSEMVKDIYKTQVEPTEVLSDCAYYYNRITEELTM